MFLTLYEQPVGDIDGLGIVRLATEPDLPEHVSLDVAGGPAYLDDEQVQKVIAFLSAVRQFRANGRETNPRTAVYTAGR